MKINIGIVDNFSKAIAGLTVVFLCYGYYDLNIYYYYFGIHISDYIGVSEILVSSINNIFLSIITVVLPLGALAGSISDMRTYYLKNGTTKKWLTKNRIGRFIIVLMFYLIILFFFRYILKQDNFRYFIYNVFIENIILMIVFILGTNFMYELFLTEKYKDNPTPIPTILFYCLIVVLIGQIFYLNSVKYEEVIKNKNQNISILLPEGKTFTTNDSIRFVGKTEHFYFFTNVHTYQYSIFPASDVKSFIGVNYDPVTVKE
jgi:hypothetical protein